MRWNDLPKRVLMNYGSIWAMKNHFSSSDSSELFALLDRVGHPQRFFWRGMAMMQAADFAGAITALENCLSFFPQNVLCRYSLGNAEELNGQYGEAIRIWKDIRAIPKLIDVGWKYYSQQKFDISQSAFSALSEIDPEAGVLGSATIMLSRKNYQEAEDILQQALYRMPNSDEKLKWQLLYGDVLMEQGAWDQAEQAYRTVLSDDFDNAEAHIRLGKVLYHSQGFAAARLEIEKGIQLSPMSESGYETLADLSVLAGQPAIAEMYFERASAIAPEKYWISVRRIDSLVTGGWYSQAIQISNEMIGNFSDDPLALSLAYERLANIYLLLGELDLAGQSIRRAIECDSTRPTVWLSAGSVYEAKADFSQAIAAYRQVLVLEPDNHQARERIDKIQP